MEAVGATLQSDISYEPGDHVGIYAANSPKLVDIILEKLVDTQYPDQLVQLEVGSDSNSKQKGAIKIFAPWSSPCLLIPLVMYLCYQLTICIVKKPC